jgi:CheY-specific phosphatase CheX
MAQRKEKIALGFETTDRCSDLFPSLLNAAERYLKDLGLEDLNRMEGIAAGGQEIELEDVTAFIQVSGGMQGGFIFSVDHHLSRQMAKHFMVDNINEVEAGQYAVEVVAEVANVITAHSLNERQKRDLFLGNPLVILSRGMGIRAVSCQEQTYSACGGKFRWMYIPKMDKSALASVVTIRNEAT